MICPACNLDNVYGMQPFSRYSFTDELVDEQLDSLDSQGNPIGIDDLPNNIVSGTYLSDGNYLNATLWLSDPILTDRHRDYFNSNLHYVMYIYDVDLDRTTGELLYSIEIYPEEDGSWTKRIIEYEPGIEFVTETGSSATRMLKIDRNYTGFFQDNNRYVNIDSELRDIGNPADIGIQFRTYVGNEGNTTDDWTRSYDAPSRRNERALEWPKVEVRAGEIATGKVLVHNFELAAAGNITFGQNVKTDNYTLEFQPNRMEYPLNGTVSSDFAITILQDVKEGILPVEVNVSISTIQNVNRSWIETFYVTVLPPLPGPPPAFPLEYLVPLYGIIITTIVGWSIPSIIGWTKSKADIRKLNYYHKRIASLYRDGKLDKNDIEAIDRLRTNILDTYSNGKLNEKHYESLMDEISILYEKIFRKRVDDSLNDGSKKETTEEQLDKIETELEYAYSEGKINEKHYDLLLKLFQISLAKKDDTS
jgi:hypothetical protein